jgi:PAT family beta-lactamase induction signal transducer AmpG
MSSAYQLGYRFAIITSDALILFIANHAGWPVSYGVMAVLMGIGVWATLKATEPLRTRSASEEKAGQDALWTPRGFFDAVVGPFIAFFKTYAWLGLLMLAFISLYRLPEFVMGPMATPFYHDLGLSKDVVGAVRTSFGLAGSLGGIAVGGLVIARFGYMKGLVIGGIMQALAIASFGALALFADSMGNAAVTFPVFGSVMFFDNFGVAMAGVALVTYMSTLTSLGYTATQYALLSSTYAIVGKFLKGFSGVVVENIQASGFSLMESYGIFFVGAGAVGLPAVALVIWLAMIQPRKTGPDATA